MHDFFELGFSPYVGAEKCPSVFLLVSHDEDDHGWQFLDGVSEELEDIALAGLAHVLDIDPGIFALANLAPGFQATRAGPQEQWVVERAPPSDDKG